MQPPWCCRSAAPVPSLAIQLREHGFARHAHEHRIVAAADMIQIAQQAQIVLQRLAETKARIDANGCGVDARGDAGSRTLVEKCANLADNVVVMRGLLHGSRFALHMHQTYSSAG